MQAMERQFKLMHRNCPLLKCSYARLAPHKASSAVFSSRLRSYAGDIQPSLNLSFVPDESSDSSQNPRALANGRSKDSNSNSLNINTPSELSTEEKFPHRWRVVVAMAVAFILCNMDKVNMSVAVIPMAADLGWSATERGFVSSSFFWGYSLTQIPAGAIATKLGGASVLMAGVALWSLGTLVAPPAAAISIWALCATRVVVGLGEGFAPSAATAVLAKSVPARERSRAVATVFGGLDVGSSVGLLLCGPLIRMYGWPSVFYLFAVLGLVWCIFWPMLKPGTTPVPVTEPRAEAARAPMDPSTNGAATSSSDPKGVAAVSTSAPAASDKVPWGAFMRSKHVWAIIVAHFCFNWGYYTLLAWLPSYFELALGLNVEGSSFLTLIPYLAMTAMTPVVGPVADELVRRGMSLTNVRKVCQCTAFVIPAMLMMACAMLTPAAGATASALGAAAVSSERAMLLVGLLSASFALSAWSRGGLYCNHQDLSPKYAGALLGITNTAGALPGVLGVSAAGLMLDATGSWAMAIFVPTAVCQVFGAIFYAIFASSETQPWS